MTDADLVLSDAEYRALLSRHPWIKSLADFAYLSRGWVGIMGEMLDALDLILVEHPELDASHWYTKEKFGGLRVHFQIPGAPAELWKRIAHICDVAEKRSLTTCERCGAPGLLRDDHGWFSVRCNNHEATR